MLLPVSPAVAGAIARGKRLREEDLEQKELRRLEREKLAFELHRSRLMLPIELREAQAKAELQEIERNIRRIQEKYAEPQAKADLEFTQARTRAFDRQATLFEKEAKVKDAEWQILKRRIQQLDEQKKIDEETRPLIAEMRTRYTQLQSDLNELLKLKGQLMAAETVGVNLEKIEQIREDIKTISQRITENTNRIREIGHMLLQKPLDPEVAQAVSQMLEGTVIPPRFADYMLEMTTNARKDAFLEAIKVHTGRDDLTYEEAEKIYKEWQKDPEKAPVIQKINDATKWGMRTRLFSEENILPLLLFGTGFLDRQPTGNQVADLIDVIFKHNDRLRRLAFDRDKLALEREKFEKEMGLKWFRAQTDAQYKKTMSEAALVKAHAYAKDVVLKAYTKLQDIRAKILLGKYRLAQIELQELYKQIRQSLPKSGKVVFTKEEEQQIMRDLAGRVLGVAGSVLKFDSGNNLKIDVGDLVEIHKSLIDSDAIWQNVPNLGGGMGGYTGGFSIGEDRSFPLTSRTQRIGETYTGEEGITTPQRTPVIILNQSPQERPPTGGREDSLSRRMYTGRARGAALENLEKTNVDIFVDQVFKGIRVVPQVIKGKLSPSEEAELRGIINNRIAPYFDTLLKSPDFAYQLKIHTDNAIANLPGPVFDPVAMGRAIARALFLGEAQRVIRQVLAKNPQKAQKYANAIDVIFTYSEFPGRFQETEQRQGGTKSQPTYGLPAGKVPGTTQESPIVRLPGEPTTKLSEEELERLVNRLVGLISAGANYYTSRLPQHGTWIIVNPQTFEDFQYPDDAVESIAEVFSKAQQMSFKVISGYAHGPGGGGILTHFNPDEFAYHVLNILRQRGWRIVGNRKKGPLSDFILVVRDPKKPGRYIYYKIVGWGPQVEGKLFKKADKNTLMQLSKLMKQAKNSPKVTFYIVELTPQERKQLYSRRWGKFTNALFGMKHIKH